MAISGSSFASVMICSPQGGYSHLRLTDKKDVEGSTGLVESNSHTLSRHWTEILGSSFTANP